MGHSFPGKLDPDGIDDPTIPRAALKRRALD